MFVSGGLTVVSMSLMLVQLKKLSITSHLYVETNEIRALNAKLDNVVYFPLELSQKVLSFFWQIHVATLNQTKVQQILLKN